MEETIIDETIIDEMIIDETRSSSDSEVVRNTSEDSGFVSNANSVSELTTDLTKTIAEDVKFKSSPLQEEVKEIKKRKRAEIDEAALERKRLATEEYNRQLHEQRYKRLTHLLKKSQFYASYLIKKIGENIEVEDVKPKKRAVQNSDAKENKQPVENSKNSKKSKIRAEYDIREYLSKDVQKQLKKGKRNLSLNLSQDDIEHSLNVNSDEDEPEKDMNEVSKYFNGELREYQLKGLQWMKVLYENGVNGILADEMGLGKTVQVIALLCHLIEKHQDGPYLIIAPLSTIPNWMIEFERFAPKIPLVVFHGNTEERKRMYSKVKHMWHMENGYKTQPVVLTTYEMPLYERSFFAKQKWRYIIIDEGQRIKNHCCQLFQHLKTMQSMNRLLLTGTPLQNNLAELWALLNFLLPEIFNDLAVFESWFDVKELAGDSVTERVLKQEEEQHVLASLREILKPFMLRREKSDVCLDIPAKKEVIVYAPLTELQHDLYKAVLQHDIHKVSKVEEEQLVISTSDGQRPQRRSRLRNKYGAMSNARAGSEVPVAPESDHESVTSDESSNKAQNSEENILSIWKQYTDVTSRNRDFLIRIQFNYRVPMYKKIVNHPYLLHCPLDPTGLPLIDENLIKASGKLLVLDAMLKKLHERGHRILLFSTLTSVLDVIEDYLSMRDYRYVRLDGTIKMQDRKERIEAFNTDHDIFLFLISTRAGGVGLNLATADTVIMYDSDWNPQADIQAMARCHRIGQKKPVVIYRLVTKGTIDEVIISRAEAKRILEKMVISKKLQRLDLRSKESLLVLKEHLESKETEIVHSEKEVFTEAELNKLLDRSDLQFGKPYEEDKHASKEPNVQILAKSKKT